MESKPYTLEWSLTRNGHTECHTSAIEAYSAADAIVQLNIAHRCQDACGECTPHVMSITPSSPPEPKRALEQESATPIDRRDRYRRYKRVRELLHEWSNEDSDFDERMTAALQGYLHAPPPQPSAPQADVLTVEEREWFDDWRARFKHDFQTAWNQASCKRAIALVDRLTAETERLRKVVQSLTTESAAKSDEIQDMRRERDRLSAELEQARKDAKCAD